MTGSLIAVAVGLFGLASWAIPWLNFLSHQPWPSILLYPQAAFAFVVLGTALYLYIHNPGLKQAHLVVCGAGAGIAILMAIDAGRNVLAMQPSLHQVFIQEIRAGSAVHPPSPWISGTLFGLGCCILLLPLSARPNQVRVIDGIGYLASFLLLTNSAILLSYFYGTPLFEPRTWMLPSLTPTIAAVALSIGLIGALGPRQFPLRPLMGLSVRARLLRTFLPVTASAVLIHSILQQTAFSRLNPVISMTLTAFASMLIAAFLVYRSAHILSHQIEQAVRESEERFGILVESLEDYAIFMLDPGGHVVTWNTGAERIIGYRAEEIIGEHFACFHTSEEAAGGKPLDSLQQAITFGSYIDQGWRIRKDGTRFWADVTITPLMDETGRLRGYANVTRDITERQTAEEALRQKTAFVQMLQMVSSAANEAASIEQAMQICIDQVCLHTGWPIGHSLLVSPSSGLLESVNWHVEPNPRLEIFRAEEGERRFENGQGLPGRVMASGASAWIRDVTKDLNFPRWRSAEKAGIKGGYAFPVKVGNEVVAVLEFFSEAVGEPNKPLLEVMGHIGTQLGRVVERSRAEAALRESEMRFRSVAQSANDAIVSCNRYGLIIAWNKGARTIFGYAEEEMLGTALSLVVPQSTAILSPETGFGRTLETIGRNKDGGEFPIELSIADWKIGDDIFFTAIIRNILKRKEAEAHISASLREKEVLLKEIHHRVKNNLQIVSSLLRLQSQSVTDPQTLDMFRESQNRVKSMALIHEYLYQSRDMARINFSDYIRNLTSHLFRSYGVEPDTIRLDLQVDESPLDLDTAVPCGLIITELVSNSLKHAFPEDRTGTIGVAFHRMDGGKRFELRVWDDGAGMTGQMGSDHKGSLGLRLVHTLTHQLGGRLEIQHGKGTRFDIAFT